MFERWFQKRLGFDQALAAQVRSPPFMNMRRIRWVIFCRVVDHYGDAGFSLRLARALTAPVDDDRHGQALRSEVLLVIDRVDLVHAMGASRVAGLTVLDWHQAVQEWSRHGVPQECRADVLIEAFACEVPQVFRDALSPSVCWITLDYLATEPWADSVHGLPSPLPAVKEVSDSVAAPSAQSLVRRWVVPGFSRFTGGLVHESWRHLSALERDQWRSRLTGLSGRALRECFLVLGFGYPDAPWANLQATLQKNLPSGFTSYKILKPEEMADLQCPGDKFKRAKGRAKALPLNHAEFDAVLQACDLNCVRGEDSFVRAHWASAGPWRVPFVWQPYRQEALGHADKLAGWMNHLLKGKGMRSWREFHERWNRLLPGQDLQWPGLCQDWPRIQDELHQSCARLAQEPALENTLWRMALETFQTQGRG
jgi:uncharacterized repeat protein (TIGR03837 family)